MVTSTRQIVLIQKIVSIHVATFDNFSWRGRAQQKVEHWLIEDGPLRPPSISALWRRLFGLSDQ